MTKTSKFNTNELKFILNQFISEEKHKTMRLNFSNLAVYAKSDLGLGGIEYYHFSRDQEISKLVKEYNKTLQSDSFRSLGENSSFTSLNIKDFVKIHGNSQEKLVFYLSQLQENLKEFYNKSIKVELEKKALEEELKKEKIKQENIKSKNKEIKKQLEELKKRHFILAEALGREEEKQFLSALQYTNFSMNNVYDINGYDENIKDLEKQKDLENFLQDYKDIFD